MKSYKVFIDSARWECAPNLVVCSRFHRYLVDNGHTCTQDPLEADYIIVNSCGVTDRGKQRTLNIIQQYTDRRKTHATVIVFGCLMDIDRTVASGRTIVPIGFSDSSRLDDIFATTERFDDIRPYCDDRLRKELTEGKHTIAVKPTTDPIKTALLDLHPFLASLPLILVSKTVRARYTFMKGRFSQNIYVEISKGCTGNCNYCLVKKAKGALHSRPIPDILLDIERLYAPDQELFLVADDCGCYGVDSDSNIIELLDAIHARFPELRFKVNYIDPRYLILHSEAFLRIFHTMSISVTMIPLQSGSQRILQKMNRHYDVAESLAVIKRIRQVSPHIMINSHFIVGHPGETWGDFVKTLAAARFFDYPAPFLYSNNAGTVSSQMTDQTSRIVGSLRVSIFILYLNVVMFFRLAESLRTKTT